MNSHSPNGVNDGTSLEAPSITEKQNSATRSVVITGGNTGLGYACATEILKSNDGGGWHIVIACRDLQKGHEAIRQLREKVAKPISVEAMQLDLASLQSVRSFASRLNDSIRAGSTPPLHGIVCNAGVQSGTKKTFTNDGFESTFGVNHLGHFLLVNLLLPALSPPARILVVASGVHDPKQKYGLPAPAWNDVTELAKGELGESAANDGAMASAQRRYTTSKLANIYFAYGLPGHLPSGITANAFDPGMMPGTGLVREAPAIIRFVAKHILPHVIPILRRVMNPNVHTVDESGSFLARLLTDPLLSNTSGKYFVEHREERSSPESYDDKRITDLWDSSKKLTGLS
jgi:NAD(P)-dependent dehydrogenase (short-subunit alcohol dehydrogenase family)